MNIKSDIIIKNIKDFLSKSLNRLDSLLESEPIVGVDIGSFSVKVAEVRKTRFSDKGTLSFGVERLRDSASSADISKAIRAALHKAGINLRWANLAIAGQEVVARYLSYPLMRKADIVKSLQFELGKHIPYKLEETVVDCQILERSLRQRRTSALLIGAKRSLIEERVRIIREVGLEPYMVSLEPFTILRVFSPVISANIQRSVAILNIGFKSTNLLILEKGIPRFSRDIVIGGYDLTQAVLEKFNLSFEAAEELKCNPRGRKDEVFDALKANLNILADELRLSFEYCEKDLKEKISSIYLSGGSSHLEGLANFLEQALEVEVILWDPTQQLSPALDSSSDECKANASILPVAIGLSLLR